jgi:beta-fructofuranosidase
MYDNRQGPQTRGVLLAAAAILTMASLGTAAVPPPLKALRDKTLVAWVAPANVTLRSGSVLTVDQLGRFDEIVLGELVPGKWMAGSDNGRRTLREQQACAAETADAQTVVQLAIVYRGHEVTIYRNGTQYARYSVPRPQWFPVGAETFMGSITLGLATCPASRARSTTPESITWP